ncbi:hypothetical protein N7517_004821 [Penicillium concentricum]|uniref:Uncharacterized protein n=1 Tax=Penicillium concentricum TaxID=293559 RepID=A0A9W9S6J5_9EURO|nr:uncharacterized protein N7517_004821 [Penicillium concentricum]KAJ5372815.1 hypothetical protein N7517_004821 [Penicillium concentricum]
MFGDSLLSAIPQYTYSGRQAWFYYGIFPTRIDANILIDIIVAETWLRSTVQREDALNNNIRAAKKPTSVDNNDLQLDQLEEEWRKINKRALPSTADTLRTGVFPPYGIVEEGLQFLEQQSWLISPGRAC